MSTEARSWTCSRCSMVIRYLPGGEPDGPLPSGWAEVEDGLICLSCTRQAIYQRVRREGGNRNVLRRELIRFELRRAPDAEAQVIASRAGTSVRTVRRERERLAAEAAAFDGEEGGANR